MPIRVYIDTSVIGGCLDSEFKEHSERLFRDFEQDRFRPLLSDLTMAEIRQADASIQGLLQLPWYKKAERIFLTQEAADLAEAYIQDGVVGSNHRVDALHIALATIECADILASWNFKHIVKWSRIRAYNAVNMKRGYAPLDIRSPREIYYEKEEDS